jgi:hypothetical protein
MSLGVNMAWIQRPTDVRPAPAYESQKPAQKAGFFRLPFCVNHNRLRWSLSCILSCAIFVQPSMVRLIDLLGSCTTYPFEFFQQQQFLIFLTINIASYPTPCLPQIKSNALSDRMIKPHYRLVNSLFLSWHTRCIVIVQKQR